MALPGYVWSHDCLIQNLETNIPTSVPTGKDAFQINKLRVAPTDFRAGEKEKADRDGKKCRDLTTLFQIDV
jgi:hypothetical protein